MILATACATAAHAEPKTVYSKKNGEVELTRNSDKAQFAIPSVAGQNRFELEGSATQIDENRFAYTSDDADKCVAVLNTTGGKLVVTTKSCESFCGMNAAGSTDGTRAHCQPFKAAESGIL